MAQLSLQPFDGFSGPEPQLFSSFASIAAGLTFDLPQADVIRNLVEEIKSHDIGASNSALRTIGRGSSFSVSVVAADSSLDSYRAVAFKRCIPPFRGEEDDEVKRRIRDIMLELRVLCHEPIRLQENVVKLLAIAWEADPFKLKRRWPVLLLERAPHGTLSDYFESVTSTSFESKVELSLDVSLGLEALHNCGIYHGDLKMENVLAFDNYVESQLSERPIVLKLADFGGALHDVRRETSLPTPTKAWAAPDWATAMTPEQVPKADMYSLGFLIWRIFAQGKDPFICDKLRSDQDLGILQSRMEEAKRSDAALFDHLRSFHQEKADLRYPLIEHLMEHTIRKDPNQRSLSETRALLQESASVLRQPEVSNGLRPHQNLLKDRLIEFSVDGIETLDPTVVDYIADELLRSIKTSRDGKIQHEAYYGLAVISINGFIQPNDNLKPFNIGLDWMQNAALAGNPQAQAFVFRMLDAFGFDVPDQVKENYIIWLSQAVSTGYFTAREDLINLGQSEVLHEAEDALRKRYGGTGARRFPDTHFPNHFPQSWKSYDEFWAEQFSKRPHCRDAIYSRFGDRLLHLAASCDLRKLTERLLGASTDDIDKVNVQGETPLLLASRAGNYHTFMLLLEAGANPRIANHVGDLPLHWLLSFEKDHAADICRRILKQGDDPDPIAKEWKYTFTGEHSFIEGTPLIRAVSRNCLDIVKILVEAGANPDFVSKKSTAINIAAYLHYPEILTYLLGASGTTPFRSDAGAGKSLLTFAMRGGCFEAPSTTFGRVRRHGRKWKSNAQRTLEVIFQTSNNNHLGDLPGFKGVNALVFAICYAQTDIAEALLELGAKEIVGKSSVDPLNLESICTPLIMSIWTKKLPIFRALIEYGADPKFLCDVGDGVPLSTLYECARVSNSNLEFALTLLKYGVPIDGGVENFETPFSCALRRRCYSFAEFLLDHNADLNIEFADGYQLMSNEQPKTVLGHLIQECSTSTLGPLEFLCNRGGDNLSFLVNKSLNFSVLHAMASISPSKQDDTALRMILEVLFEHFELDQDQHDLRFSVANYSALHVAVMHANEVVVERLLREGCSPNVKEAQGFLPLDLARFCLQEFPRLYPLDDLVIPKPRFLRKLRLNAERIESLLEKATTILAYGET